MKSAYHHLYLKNVIILFSILYSIFNTLLYTLEDEIRKLLCFVIKKVFFIYKTYLEKNGTKVTEERLTMKTNNWLIESIFCSCIPKTNTTFIMFGIFWNENGNIYHKMIIYTTK